MSEKHWVDDTVTMVGDWPELRVYGPSRWKSGGAVVHVPGNEKARPFAESPLVIHD